jgi:iron-sulfur cluster repair protein YtfE (RIC family)
MYTIHQMFRREFGLLPGLVRSVAADDKERVQNVADHIRMIQTILHEHHTAEDTVLWPALSARAPREIDPIVHLVEGHHEGIEKLLAEIGSLLDDWAATAVHEDGESLALALERLVVALYEHMGLEEKLILPLVARHVFATEWEKMVSDGAASIPPEFGPVLTGMLMYEGGVEIVPPELREVLADIGPQAYAAHSERVHGTPTPPRSTDIVIGTPHVAVGAGRL